MTVSHVYVIAGIVLSVLGAVLALARGRSAPSFYARDVYAMTGRSHVAFAAISAAFALAFVGSLRVPALGVPLLAVYTLLLVLYGASFLRGYGGEEE